MGNEVFHRETSVFISELAAVCFVFKSVLNKGKNKLNSIFFIHIYYIGIQALFIGLQSLIRDTAFKVNRYIDLGIFAVIIDKAAVVSETYRIFFSFVAERYIP